MDSNVHTYISGTLSHWFIPYKVKGGKLSSQCGTKEFKPKARQGKAIKPKKPKPNAKILEYLQYIYIYQPHTHTHTHIYINHLSIYIKLT